MFEKHKQRRAEAAMAIYERAMNASYARGILAWTQGQPDVLTDQYMTARVEALHQNPHNLFALGDLQEYAKAIGSTAWVCACGDIATVIQNGGAADPMHRVEVLTPPRGERQPAAPSAELATHKPSRKAQQKRPERRSHVYVISAEGLPIVKIGKANNPTQRVRELQTGSPAKLSVAWATQARPDLEYALHDRLSEYREGGEWFDLTSLGDPVTVVRDEVERIRKEATDKGTVARYFYED